MKYRLLSLIGIVLLALALGSSGHASASDLAAPKAATAPATLTTVPMSSLSSYRYTAIFLGDGGFSGMAPINEFAAGMGEKVINTRIDVSGAFEAPDKTSLTAKFLNGDPVYTETVIGDQAWIGHGDQIEAPQTIDFGASELAFPSIWDLIATKSDHLKCESKVTTILGVDTHKCSLDSKSFSDILDHNSFLYVNGVSEISQFALDSYVTKDGYPMRIIFVIDANEDTVFGYVYKVDIEVTDVNSPDIDIEAPN